LARHLSVEKRKRQSEKANLRNRMVKSKLKTAKKKLEVSIEKKDTGTMTSLFNEYVSMVDTAVSKGVIHRNTASRKKMRMAKKINDLARGPVEKETAAVSARKTAPKKRKAASRTPASAKKAVTGESAASAKPEASAEQAVTSEPAVAGNPADAGHPADAEQPPDTGGAGGSDAASDRGESIESGESSDSDDAAGAPSSSGAGDSP
jgi:small subunit ribosomal protein S20